jgi:hypothetical protein
VVRVMPHPRAAGRPGVGRSPRHVLTPLTAAFAGADRCYSPCSPGQTELGLAPSMCAGTAGRAIVFPPVSHADGGLMMPTSRAAPDLDRIREFGVVIRDLPRVSTRTTSQGTDPVFGVYPNPIGSGGINCVDGGTSRPSPQCAAEPPSSPRDSRWGPAWIGDSIAAVYSDLLGRDPLSGDDPRHGRPPPGTSPEAGPTWRSCSSSSRQGLSASLGSRGDRELPGREPRAFEDFAREPVAAREMWPTQSAAELPGDDAAHRHMPEIRARPSRRSSSPRRSSTGSDVRPRLPRPLADPDRVVGGDGGLRGRRLRPGWPLIRWRAAV